MGDPEADVENEVLKAEQSLQVAVFFLNASIFYRLYNQFTEFFLLSYLQVGQGDRGDVTILPTLIINNAQYRGLFHYFSLLHVCLEFGTKSVTEKLEILNFLI